MIHLYYRQRCSSSLKAIQRFKRYGLDVCVQPSDKISREELITVLTATDKGISSLIKHSRNLSNEDMAKIRMIKTMTFNQAIDYIKKNPTLLKSPIIIENNKVLIGYNLEQIRIFLPKIYRRKSLCRNIKDNFK
ncbi:ArsC/Spx/MgsR family protein [Lactococcus garvieae]|uniref:ArsC/Spx/MgsR family protein n=1 Tax=Lactococcus garvieae TaxID=1363 RepID=UPI00398E8EED